jgi:hypothetical protein
MLLYDDPVLAQHITIANRPSLPAMNHQESVSQYTVAFGVIPFSPSDLLSVNHSFHGVGEGHLSGNYSCISWRYGLSWSWGMRDLFCHSLSSLYLSKTNISMMARWLILRCRASHDSIFLHLSLSLKLVACLIHSIVAQNALHVKGEWGAIYQ